MENRPNHAEIATEIITKALDDLYPLESPDVLANEVWQCLNDGVVHGWCSAEDAQERYAAWWQQYRAVHNKNP